MLKMRSLESQRLRERLLIVFKTPSVEYNLFSKSKKINIYWQDGAG